MQVSDIQEQGATSPSTFSRFISDGSRFLGSTAILVMFVGVIYEIVSRSFFGHGTIWITEVSTYLVIVITFICAAFAASQGAHVRVDLVLELFPEGTRTLITTATRSLSLFLTLIALWKVTGFCAENYYDDARSWSVLNTPLWMPQTFAVAGLFGLTVVLADMGSSKTGPWGYAPWWAPSPLPCWTGPGSPP